MAILLVSLWIASLVLSFVVKGARRAFLIAAAVLTAVVVVLGFPAATSWAEFGVEELRRGFGNLVPLPVAIDRLEHDISLTQDEIRGQAKVVATAIVDLADAEAKVASINEDRETLLRRIDAINAMLKKSQGGEKVMILDKSYRREDVDVDLRAKLNCLAKLDSSLHFAETIVLRRQEKHRRSTNSMLSLDDRRGQLAVGLAEIRARFEEVKARGGSDNAGSNRIAAAERQLAETKRQVEIAYQESVVSGQDGAESGIDPLQGEKASVTELADAALARARK